MKWVGIAAGIGIALLVACASAPPPAPAATKDDSQDSDDDVPDEPDAATTSDSFDASVIINAPERTAPPSTKTYEEAMSKPEPLNVNDERVHLTDGQLNGPMRGAIMNCRVPGNARVTIKTAVQYGRAIGVTVTLKYQRPKNYKPPKPQSKAAKAEAKRTAKIIACVDTAVRLIVWPPSSRRDSFTTEF